MLLTLVLMLSATAYSAVGAGYAGDINFYSEFADGVVSDTSAAIGDLSDRQREMFQVFVSLFHFVVSFHFISFLLMMLFCRLFFKFSV
jgi:hypothetical protein